MLTRLPLVRPRSRRGVSLMWSVAALTLAVAMTPLYVRLCHSLVRLTARGGHRLIAVNAGTAELEALSAGRSANGADAARGYALPQLPQGRCEVAPGPVRDGLREVRVTVSWLEASGSARCEWVTLVVAGGAAP